MWLEQKIYSFKCEKNKVTSEDILSTINLKVNDELTTVKLYDLFLKVSTIKFDNEDQILEIKGWSILERTIPKTGELRVKKYDDNDSFKDVKLSFYSNELGEMIIVDIENPIFQASDKESKDSDVKAFDAKIIELSVPEKNEEAQGGGTGSPHSNPSLLNKKYEIARARFVNNGYEEFKSGNFRLLVKKSEYQKTVLLIELVDESKLNQFKEPTEVTEGFYQFLDEAGNVVGDSFSQNVVDSTFAGNNINNTFQRNIIGQAFAVNVIHDSFADNIVGSQMQGNKKI